MSIATLILGQSGTGKSTSLRNLNPNEVLLIQVVKKPLPFRSAEWKYLSKDGGSIYVTDNPEVIIKRMQQTSKPIIIIDDYQYVMANEYMRRSTETGFNKFTEIGRKTWDVFTEASNLADNKRVYILSHTEEAESGKTKIKTIGKMLDEKITLEGMVTICLQTGVINEQYIFHTKNSGLNTVKSPIGLFESDHIENDLEAVDTAICDYYGIAKTETQTTTETA
ncbi:AAA family ATPase [Acinetobacter baumannii]|uniref:AAA family ATPase n=1 Tax=Acinetobacter baumannii TaxID=470 RepID=UPI00035579EA|nr:AAA family ATPase [Acinetobacter baumannii]AGQ07152.1 hypothetical protein BJAB0715_02506 [Acinetobacter baumannii BJAB0715]AMN02109.1 ATP-binding protein [Acinetobacter baumannii]MDB0261012.1 ATP-binding protein [Acinetobacter baumannii]MDB0306434.1 ATP-binding protein [Acinetobacter baumannii]MVO48828.1 AAA family ATPase [Acinetobacter baumannii]